MGFAHQPLIGQAGIHGGILWQETIDLVFDALLRITWAKRSMYSLLVRPRGFCVHVNPDNFKSHPLSAGRYGSGRRGGGVSTLICAVVDDLSGAARVEAGDPLYSSFCRIGSGLTYADYVKIRGYPWKTRDKMNPPPFLQTVTEREGIEDKGDIYLEPEEYVAGFGQASWLTRMQFLYPSSQGGRDCTIEFVQRIHVGCLRMSITHFSPVPRGLHIAVPKGSTYPI
jgi:hypothetical protein